MSSIDEIWASMNESSGVKPSKDKAKTKKSSSDASSKSKSAGATVSSKVMISYEDMMKTKMSRDINASNEKEVGERKRALKNIQKTLFEDHDMTNEDYGKVFRDIGKHIFKRFADPVEKCRELSQKITEQFFTRCYDVSPILGYYFPALMARLPAGLAYDDEMKVFVVDMEAHEAYRRGKAVDRQDKEGTIGGASHQVVETSEEIRLATCVTLFALIKQTRDIGNCTVLHAYFQDVIMFLQAQLRDPCPDLKAVACQALEVMAQVSDFEVGMKLYAVGLVRGILPVLRHRHSKVRLAALSALRVVLTVPDRAKRKAAGSDAIPDVVGFREENVLQVAAFYKPEVQINYLAELVNDKSVPVREKLVEFLTDLLTTIGDRYDHQTRLSPYLLDLLTDEADSVANGALACLVTCGRQYEQDHADEIIERRQYGVDGDDRINLDKPLPRPFVERPRLGIRLYVRGNTKRFLTALVNELTNWVSTTRLKSAQLLKMITVLCEEHLTMEIHSLLPSFIKALRFARDDKDAALHAVLLEVFELLGRYILPEVYIHYLLPRLRGDPDVAQFGADAETRITVMEFLQALLEGSKPSLLPPFFEEVVAVLTDPYHINPESVRLQHSAMDVLITVLRSMKGKGNAVVEAHFVATGRLTNLKSTIRKTFRFLLLNLSNPELHQKATAAMLALADLEADAGAVQPVSSPFVDPLSCWHGAMLQFHTHGVPLLTSLLRSNEYQLDDSWSATSAEHVLLSRLVECPAYVVQSDPSSLTLLLHFLCDRVRTSADECGDAEEDVLCAFSDLLVSTLLPIYTHSFDTNKTLLYRTRQLVADKRAGSAPVQEYIPQLGLSSAVSPEAAASAAQVVSAELLDKVVQTFVLDLRWNRSVRLLQQKLSVLSVLLGTSSSAEEACDGEYLVVDKRGCQVPAAPLGPLSLLRSTSLIFDTLLSSVAVPTTPVQLRITALEIACRILRTVAHCGGLSRVKSFRRQSEAAGREEALRGKLAVQKGIASIVTMLDDSSNRVRLEALAALNTAVGLILSDEDVAYIAQHPHLRGGAAAGSEVSYAGVVSKLLALLSISNTAGVEAADEEAAFADQLNDSLRLVAALDPSVFEGLVRAEVDGLGALQGSTGYEKQREALSGLVNHVDILNMLVK